MSDEVRTGVYVCHCGSNIAATVDVEAVSKWAGDELGDKGVVVARDYKFMCSSLGQELIEADIRDVEKDIVRMLADVTGTKPEEVIGG